VGLLYVGCVLFINSLMLLKKIDGKSASIINLFVGLIQVIYPTYIIFNANNDLDTILSASGLYLFGFTYLYVAITNWTGISTLGVGYYSLWVAIITLFYFLINIFVYDDVKFAFIWLNYFLLWFLFFLI
jgi:uncharacterized membrane protein